MSVDQIQGVKINFIPENSKGEQLTSKAFKDLCTFSILGKLLTNKYYTYERILQPLGYVGSEAENAGGGGNSGGGTQNGGDNNSGGGTNGDDDDERPGAGG